MAKQSVAESISYFRKQINNILCPGMRMVNLRCKLKLSTSQCKESEHGSFWFGDGAEEEARVRGPVQAPRSGRGGARLEIKSAISHSGRDASNSPHRSAPLYAIIPDATPCPLLGRAAEQIRRTTSQPQCTRTATARAPPIAIAVGAGVSRACTGRVATSSSASSAAWSPPRPSPRPQLACQSSAAQPSRPRPPPPPQRAATPRQGLARRWG